MRSYYHAAMAEDEASILSEGLRPSHAGECECGVGIHVSRDVETARDWAVQLRDRRWMHEKEYIIVEIAFEEDEYTVVEDSFVGGSDTIPDGDALVVCAERPIPPSALEVVERVQYEDG